MPSSPTTTGSARRTSPSFASQAALGLMTWAKHQAARLARAGDACGGHAGECSVRS